MKQIKGERIAKLQAMLDSINDTINAILRVYVDGANYSKKNEMNATNWETLCKNRNIVYVAIQESKIGFVDVEAIRSQVSRSL